MSKIKVNALDLNYNEFGAGNAGTPVLLQHGLGHQAKFMEPLAKLLVDKYKHHVYTLDLPGYGLSDRREDHASEKDQTYSIDSLAKDLVGFLDAMNVKKIILLGHSMGGMVAQAVAKSYPDRIEKLVLLATASCTKAPAVAMVLGKVMPFRTMLTMAFKRQFPQDYPKDKLDEVVAESMKCTSRFAYLKTLKQITRKHFFSEPWLPQIKIPTLVIGSENDHVVGYEASKTIQILIPGAILYTIKNGSHNAHLLHTEEVATAIGKFIAS